MPNALTIIIPLIPRGQRRARHAVIHGHARAYKDPKQAQEERSLEALLAPFRPPAPLSGPLLLGVRAYLPIPASKPKKWKAGAIAGHIRPTCKPDMDNLLKHLKDCMSVMRFWEDDRQVVEYLPGTGKYYGELPRWEVELREMNQGA